MAVHVIKIRVDGQDNASGALKSASGALDSFGSKAKGLGGALTAGITLPLVGLGAVAIKMSTDLNAAMANIASLGVPTDRVIELKTAVQDMSITVGKSTDDLAGGLYQIISAFGDTADTVAILGINARLAAAGLSTTAEAINLTSAVTKAWNDTSAEAVQKASDLALETVRLGQTTLPELAASYGQVTPMAVALGVSQEELAGQFATLTGVTGNTSAVATQLRATYQALIKPTTDMGAAIASVAGDLESSGQLVGGPLVENWRFYGNELTAAQEKLYATITAIQVLEKAGKTNGEEYKKLTEQYKIQNNAVESLSNSYDAAATALGPAIIQSVGFNDALGLLTVTAGGNTDVLGKMFGSVEALNAVLALTGAQAGTLTEKTAAMMDVTGATDAAFAAQTEGINAAGFAMAQARQKMEVFAQKMGDALAPALLAALDAVQPLLDGLLGLANQFTALSPTTQRWMLALTGVAAAAGPVIFAVGWLAAAFAEGGALAGGLAAIGTGFGLLLSPIALVAAAVAGLGAVFYGFNIGGFRDGVDNLLVSIGNLAKGFQTFLSGTDFAAFQTSITGAFGDIWAAVQGFFSGDISVDSLGGIITEQFGAIRTAITDLFSGTDFAQFLTEIKWDDFVAKLTWENFVAVMSSWGTYITELAWDVWLTAVDWGQWVVALPWGDYITALGNWGVYISKLAWGAVLPVLSSWGTYITSLDWTTIVIKMLDWATWIPAMVWNNFVGILEWSVKWIPRLTWASFVTLLNWGKWVVNLPWSEWIGSVLDWSERVVKLPWGDWIGAILRWSVFVTKITWSSFVDKLKWPNLDLDWGAFIPDWPGWGFFNPFGGGSEPPPGESATGTRHWRGGLTWVGEKGAELVNLPRGSQVFNHERSTAMTGALENGATYNVTFAPVINSDIDLEVAFDRLLKKLGRRRP